MEYGLVVWYQPIRGEERRRGSVGVARQLVCVQRQAVKLITGAFKTAATDVMEYHAFVPPVRMRLNRTVRNIALKLGALPKSHPLNPHIRWCASHYVRRHRSPLHEIFNAFPDAYDVETIDPTPTRLAWTPRCTWAIARSRDEAVKEAGEARDDVLAIFSDGSGYKKGVGAAAVAETKQGTQTRRFHLGPLASHTVFEGEVMGTILALDIIRNTPRIRSATILLDNQACIRALAANRPQPGQYLIREFHCQLEALLRAKPRLEGKIHLQWVPGHNGVEGNELADQAAKEAAEGVVDVVFKGRAGWLNSPLPASIAARRAEGTKRMWKEWREEWSHSSRATKLAPIDKSPPPPPPPPPPASSSSIVNAAAPRPPSLPNSVPGT
ncbi:ribonuclease H-like domain-containing protein [Favolaschia claudopus]|uniref:Ribonuclease H-like domain-containing protein n=1 Tax=Favolaschia claudopus TaxID=2862362 RepID=A0AAW0AQK8_9AGAR